MLWQLGGRLGGRISEIVGLHTASSSYFPRAAADPKQKGKLLNPRLTGTGARRALIRSIKIRRHG